MQVIVLVALAGLLSVMAWQLVHSAPRQISILLPQPLTFAIGALLFGLGVFGAFTGARIYQDPGVILFALLRMYVGLWFMLAATAGMRGSEDDAPFIRRLFGMIAMLIAALIGSLYLDSREALAALQLVMIAGGFWLTINYLRLTDRGG
jgi:Na+/phosphate symporter